eukprot:37888_1
MGNHYSEMMDMKHSKKCDQSQTLNREYLTFGFIRQIIDNSSNLNLFIVPIDIYDLIYGYFGKMDYIDLNNIGKNHTLNKNIITHNGIFTWNSSLFVQKIKSGKHSWSFKLIKYGTYIDIGIWKLRSGNEPTYKSFADNNNGYCYNIGDGQKYDGYKFENYGVKCKDNDIICMHFDANLLILKYSVNNVDQGIAYYVENTKYKAAIGTGHNGESVEFINYTLDVD